MWRYIVLIAICSMANPSKANSTASDGTVASYPFLTSHGSYLLLKFVLAYVIGFVCGGVTLWLGWKLYSCMKTRGSDGISRFSMGGSSRDEPAIVFEDWPNQLANLGGNGNPRF